MAPARTTLLCAVCSALTDGSRVFLRQRGADSRQRGLRHVTTKRGQACRVGSTPFVRDVGLHLEAVSQAYTRYLPQRRVGLLRHRGIRRGCRTPRFAGYRAARGLSLSFDVVPAVADELVDSRHNPEAKVAAGSTREAVIPHTTTGQWVDCLPAWAGVYDFEAAARDNRWVVMHHNDRFLGSGAQNAVPPDRTEWPWNIDHQASPPFSRRR